MTQLEQEALNEACSFMQATSNAPSRTELAALLAEFAQEFGRRVALQLVSNSDPDEAMEVSKNAVRTAAGAK